MENSDYYYRKYKKYKMLYKKVGGMASLRRAAARRGHNVGIINLTMEIEQQLDKINDQQQTVLNTFKENEAVQLEIQTMRKNIQIIKEYFQAMTEELSMGKNERNYKSLMEKLHEASALLNKRVIPNISDQYKDTVRTEVELKHAMGFADDKAQIKEAQALMLALQAAITAVKESFELFKKIVGEIPHLTDELKQRQLNQ